ncbi:MAG: aminomethyltransferase beta-barrel domain-containing protein, partial [Kofleriaceae bacterium]
ALKDESQEICFVPDGNYAGFVSTSALRRGRALPMAGAIVDHDGTVLGRHDGTHKFTVGQHRGLGNLVTPPDASGKARIPDKRYVTALDPVKGEVHVGPREAAERRELQVRDLRWLSPPRAALAGTVQVRHRGQPIDVAATIDGTTATLELAEATVAAPGQAAVFYDGDRVLAGGWVV